MEGRIHEEVSSGYRSFWHIDVASGGGRHGVRGLDRSAGSSNMEGLLHWRQRRLRVVEWHCYGNAVSKLRRAVLRCPGRHCEFEAPGGTLRRPRWLQLAERGPRSWRRG